MITYLFVGDWEASQVHEGHEDGLILGAKEAWLLGMKRTYRTWIVDNGDDLQSTHGN
jgi:hypothetical protein